MVSVPLKGVHVVRRKHVDGTVVEHHYAWRGKGAPKLEGKPGTREYLRSYEAAHVKHKDVPEGTFKSLIVDYKKSPAFTDLGEHSDRAYRRYLDQMQEKFGALPLPALDDPKVRRHFLKWRDEMSKHPRSADYAISVLKKVLSWGVEYCHLATNQAEPIGKLHSVDKSDDIWTEEDFTAFFTKGGRPAEDGSATVVSDELRWAVQLARYTGFREGDLLKLPRSSYDGSSFAGRTNKRGKRVIVPAVSEARALMEEIPTRGVVILTNARRGLPWTEDGFRSSFGKACKWAGVKRTFHDLRRTAATNLLKAGLDSTTVAMIMGWSEAAVESLKKKYVSRKAVVEAVVAKMEAAR